MRKRIALIAGGENTRRSLKKQLDEYICNVIAKGQMMVKNEQIKVYGTFEKGLLHWNKKVLCVLSLKNLFYIQI